MDIILPLTGLFSDPLTGGGLEDEGERCEVFFVTGDLEECFEKTLAWFASLFGQPDKLNKGQRLNYFLSRATIMVRFPIALKEVP